MTGRHNSRGNGNGQKCLRILGCGKYGSSRDFVRSYLGRVFKVVSVNDECGWPSNPDYDCPCYDGACEQVEAAVETMSLFVASYPEVFVRERLQAA